MFITVARWFGVNSWQRSRKRAFPVHRPYTGLFTSVLREHFSMAASSSSILRVFWLVLPIVSVFDRALEMNPRVRESVSHYEGKKTRATEDGG